MIGQTELLNRLYERSNKQLPRFMIFVGDKGSGKKTLITEIQHNYMYKGYPMPIYRAPDTKIESIRNLITEAYKTRVPAWFVIADADSMSVNAKNALLKITEEPPNNAYFIMTLEDINNTLDTIKSRATVYTMDKYSREELETFFRQRYKATPDYEKLVIDLSETPGDIMLLQSTGGECKADEFYAYVEKVFDNIGVTSGANAFKISEKIALKDTDEDKYDLRMFWKAFQKVALSKASELEGTKAIQMIQITSRALQDLKIKSLNKAMLFDIWVLDIRRVWL